VRYRSDDLPHYADVSLPNSWTSHDWTGGSTSQDEAAIAESSVKRYAFNAHKSNAMPLRRFLPDYRSRECAVKQYPVELPKASVIICFVNEMWSSLLRTVWSVLDRSPSTLLHEIILVNDASDADWLGAVRPDLLLASPPCAPAHHSICSCSGTPSLLLIAGLCSLLGSHARPRQDGGLAQAPGADQGPDAWSAQCDGGRAGLPRQPLRGHPRCVCVCVCVCVSRNMHRCDCPMCNYLCYMI
jgi:hypothetical protein